MKRPIALVLIAAALVAPGACRERLSPEAQAVPEPDGWVMTPEIDAVVAAGEELDIRGRAAPLGRVAVGDPGGQTHAAAADTGGRFDLRIPRPRRDTLFVVEARAGQSSHPAPYRLLIAAAPAGPAALVSIGAPTRRLDPGPSLDSVDSDGRASFLSGRAPAGSAVDVGAGLAPGVQAAADGRWSVAITGGDIAPVAVGGTLFAPPSGPAGVDGVLERAGAGWRISWSAPGGARQTTWFPDRRADQPGLVRP